MEWDAVEEEVGDVHRGVVGGYVIHCLWICYPLLVDMLCGYVIHCLVPDAWDVDNPEPEGERLLFQVPDAGVPDVLEAAVPEDPREWFVVDSHDEVSTSQDEMSSLV